MANNILTGNALPGVAMHTHAPFQSLNDHLIIGNQISGNGPDGDPGTTVPTGISIFSPVVPLTGIVITQNVFKGEGIDIAMNAVAGTSVAAHLNSFFGPVGVDNIGSGTISATANWWKCAERPGRERLLLGGRQRHHDQPLAHETLLSVSPRGPRTSRPGPAVRLTFPAAASRRRRRGPRGTARRCRSA